MRGAAGLCRAALAVALCLGAWPAAGAAAGPRPTVVVSTSVLGALVSDLAGGRLEVKVAIPNGLDPHEWEPSARDVAALGRADLLVVNGLGLEEGMQRALAQARARGVPVFTAADHVAIRRVRAGEGLPAGDPDQAAGAADPHLWTDPLAMKAVARALAGAVRERLGVDLGDRLGDLERRLDGLDAEIRRAVQALPPERRKLVTGHESLGYFAERYGFRLVGAVVPGLSSSAASSAAQLAALRETVARERVRVIFTEVGTPPRVVEALARECSVRAVPLVTHAVPADGSYFTFLRGLARTVVEGLR